MPDQGSSRRTVLQMGAAMALSACATPGARAADKRQPNIIFIMADDLGYADLSCYGRREYQTPNIDALADDGVKFMQAYANSSVCSATRTALMTGQYQYRLPVGLEEPLSGRRHVGLPPEVPTLPSLLRASGYQTALIGKWHLGRLPDYGPLKSGYDHFWGFREGSVDYFTHDSFGGRPDLWDGEVPIETTGYATELLGEKCAEMITHMHSAGRAFFISLHFTAPHWPWEGPNDEAEAERLANGHPMAITHFDGGSMETYAEMVTALDTEVGRVMAALRSLNISENTIVVFTSDNGGERFSETWPFTGKKTELLEGGLRVPAIVRWPGVAPAGAISDQVCITMDFVPTLLAAAGAQPDPAYPSDGIDLTPAIAGGAPVPRQLFFRYLYRDQQAYRDGDWKYLKIMDNTFLFNIAEDPLERANLKLRDPERFERMVREYGEWEATMLPLDPNAMTHGYTGDLLADHFSEPVTQADH